MQDFSHEARASHMIISQFFLNMFVSIKNKRLYLNASSTSVYLNPSALLTN